MLARVFLVGMVVLLGACTKYVTLPAPQPPRGHAVGNGGDPYLDEFKTYQRLLVKVLRAEAPYFQSKMKLNSATFASIVSQIESIEVFRSDRLDAFVMVDGRQVFLREFARLDPSSLMTLGSEVETAYNYDLGSKGVVVVVVKGWDALYGRVLRKLKIIGHEAFSLAQLEKEDESIFSGLLTESMIAKYCKDYGILAEMSQTTQPHLFKRLERFLIRNHRPHDRRTSFLFPIATSKKVAGKPTHTRYRCGHLEAVEKTVVISQLRCRVAIVGFDFLHRNLLVYVSITRNNKLLAEYPASVSGEIDYPYLGGRSERFDRLFAATEKLKLFHTYLEKAPPLDTIEGRQIVIEKTGPMRWNFTDFRPSGERTLREVRPPSIRVNLQVSEAQLKGQPSAIRLFSHIPDLVDGMTWLYRTLLLESDLTEEGDRKLVEQTLGRESNRYGVELSNALHDMAHRNYSILYSLLFLNSVSDLYNALETYQKVSGF